MSHGPWLTGGIKILKREVLSFTFDLVASSFWKQLVLIVVVVLAVLVVVKVLERTETGLMNDQPVLIQPFGYISWTSNGSPSASFLTSPRLGSILFPLHRTSMIARYLGFSLSREMPLVGRFSPAPGSLQFQGLDSLFSHLSSPRKRFVIHGREPLLNKWLQLKN